MRIVFISHEYPLWPSGGVGSFLQTYGKALSKRGYEIIVVGMGDVPNEVELKDEEVTIYRLPKKKSLIPNAIVFARLISAKIKQLHKKSPISIVEASEMGLALLKIPKGIKRVIRLHGGHHFFTTFENRPTELKKVILEKISFRNADAFIAVSNYVSEITFSMLSLKNKPLAVIYNPINTLKFPQVNYDLKKKDSLLFIGTVCEKKGIRQLVNAMPLIKEEITNVHLTIVGRDWTFPNGTSYIKYLKKEIPDELKDNITIVGAVPHNEIYNYIAKAEVCVYPSHMEAMPIAWLEALSAGNPLLGSSIGPGFEAINNNETGLLCDPHNIKDIAEKTVFLLKNKNAARKMGIAARKDMLQRFEINEVINQNISFYNNILSTN